MTLRSVLTRKAILVPTLLALLSACTTTQKTSTSGSSDRSTETTASEVMGPPEPYGPQPLSNNALPPVEPAYGPEAPTIRPVVLVLGPGMARGFSYAGVLRALHEAKIPIGAIVGTEIGGLIGALYAVDGNLNHFEWALARFRDDAFVKKGYFSLFDRRASRLSQGLAQAFGEKVLEKSKIRTLLCFQLKEGAANIAEKGSLREVVGATMSSSCASGKPFPVSEAKALGIGPVVLVDAMSGQNGGSGIGEADIVIRPDLRDLSDEDFSKRTEAAFRGKKATLDQIELIKQATGLSRPAGGSQ